MPGLIAEPLAQYGMVRIVLDVADMSNLPEEAQLLRSRFLPFTAQWYDAVEKVRPRPTTVADQFAQYGTPWEMTGSADVWYDTEAPLDTPVYYVVELVGGDASYVTAHAAVELVDAGFDTSVAAWTADTGAAVALNTTTPIAGAGSLRITAAGGTAVIGARSPRTAASSVVAGRRYMAELVLRAGAAATDLRVAVDWFTNADAAVSTSQGTVLTAPAGVVVTRRAFFTAPATSGKAELRVRWAGTPTGGHTVDVDVARLVDLGDAYDDPTATPVTLVSDDGGWLHTPEVPAGAIRLDLLPSSDCEVDVEQGGVLFLSHPAESFASTGARFDVIDQALPSVVTGRRKAPTATLTIASLSFADRDAVAAELATGAVLMLRLPPEFGISDRYLDVGDTGTAALVDDLRVPYRVHDLPYAQAPTPAAPTAGVLGTRFADLDRYETWADFDPANLTTTDVLLGAGSTVGVGAL